MKQRNPPAQRRVLQLFDHVFKCLMSLSDTAVISFINALFSTSYLPASTVSRPSPETVEISMRRTLADMVITINGDSYLIETQISNDLHMGVRIFQYIMNEGRSRGRDTGDHVIRIKLPQARVIYWEPTAATPERESIVFMFPGGEEYRYEVPSVKFSEYTVKGLEDEGLGLLLPFCVMKYRREAERAESGEERRRLAASVESLVEEVVGAAERSVERGSMGAADAGNVVLFTRILWEELYQSYTEFKEEERMWEHIKVVDFDSLWKERDEAKRQVDEAKRQAEEAIRQAEETRRQAEETRRQAEETRRQAEEELSREREAAIRKLLKAGVSREQLATAGLLESAE